MVKGCVISVQIFQIFRSYSLEMKKVGGGNDELYYALNDFGLLEKEF